MSESSCPTARLQRRTEDRFTYVPTGQLPITAQGQNLEIGGIPTKFTGFNAYQLATDWGTNAGCGGMATPAQIDCVLRLAAPNSSVRFWAIQGTMATNIHTHQLDWTPLDKMFYAAAKYHVYLIPVISDQAGTCDSDHWQDPAWYSGGFRDVYNSPADTDGRGLTPLSYWDYMNALVSRYADSPALGHVGANERGRSVDLSRDIRVDAMLGTPTCPERGAAAQR